ALVVNVGRDRLVLGIQPGKRPGVSITSADVGHRGPARARSRSVAVIGQRRLRAERREQRGGFLRLAGPLQAPPFPIERRQADGTVRLELNGLIKRATGLLVATALVQQPPRAPISFRGQALRLLLSSDLLIGLD